MVLGQICRPGVESIRIGGSTQELLIPTIHYVPVEFIAEDNAEGNLLARHPGCQGRINIALTGRINRPSQGIGIESSLPGLPRPAPKPRKVLLRAEDSSTYSIERP